MKLCRIPDCKNVVTDRENHLCRTHHGRLQRNGDPLKLVRNPKGEGSISDGYRVITVNGVSGIREHRHIVEQAIGRPLTPGELVHHIDGNRLNNDIDNLQVMTRPSHQKLHHTTTFRDNTHKQCVECKTIKPRWQFRTNFRATDSNQKDKHRPYCINCDLIKTNAYKKAKRK